MRGLRRAAAIGAVLAVVALAGLVSGPLGGTRAARADADCGGDNPVKSDGTAWVCTFDDEFNGDSLDPTLWVTGQTANTGFTTGPPGAQACYLDNGETILEGDGLLALSVFPTAPFSCPDPVTGPFTTQYVAGEVFTNPTFSQTYGLFEVRAMLPEVAVAGLQETLWLWPEDDTHYGGWPLSGEIDFGEFFSKYAYLDVPTIHYALDPSTINMQTNTNVYTSTRCYLDYTKFNTYGVEWEPGTITILLNGSPCLVDNYAPSNVAAPAPFDQPFFLALTQGLGVANGTDSNAFNPGRTPLPATTYVDWVRIWQ